MKALLKSGEWVDIDTQYVSSREYKTADGKYLKDYDIIRLYEDVRLQYPDVCKCGYCGKLCLTKDDYERHIKDELSLVKRNCGKCSFLHEKWETLDYSEQEETEVEKSAREIGRSFVKTITRTKKYRITPHCSYKEGSNPSGCSCTHEAHGSIKPETFEKSYFVRKPYGDLFENFNRNWNYQHSLNSLSNSLSSSDTMSFEERIRGSNDRLRAVDFEINVKTLAWTAVVRTEKKKISGGVCVTGHIWDGGVEVAHDGKPDTGFEGAVEREIKKVVGEYTRYVTLYNERVSNDLYYTQPDGTMLDEVEIDGKKISRPKPIDTSGWTFKEKSR